jgi:hypothetical protein
MRVYIRANSPFGLPVATRGGRQWPTGQTKEVEVVDGDEDPQTDVTVDGRPTKQPDPNRINRQTLERIKKDPRFSVLENAKAEEDLNAAKAEIASLRARVAELESQLGGQVGQVKMDEVTAVGETEQKELAGTEGRDEGHRKGPRGR